MKTIFSDPELENNFRRNGWVVVPLLRADEVGALSELHQSTTPDVPRDYYATAFSQEASYRETIRKGVDAVLLPRLKTFFPGFYPCLSSYVAKRGRSKQGRVSLHQDFSTVEADKHTALHVWCALIDVDESNGCLKAVSGSHTFFNHISTPTNNPAPYDSLRGVMEEHCSTSVPMKAGSAFIFDERLLHWSDENQTDSLRVAVGSIMIPEGVAPLLYMWDKEKPKQLTLLEVTVEYLTRLKVGTLISEPYPEGVRFVKTIPYEFRTLTAEDIAPLYRDGGPVRETAAVVPASVAGNGDSSQSALKTEKNAHGVPAFHRRSWMDRLKAWVGK
jgi:hypothetical protein